MSTVMSNLDDLVTKISNMSSGSDTTNSSLSAMNALLTTMNGTLTTDAANIANMNSGITTLNSNIITMNNAIASMNGNTGQFRTQSNTFTSTTNGTIVDISTTPMHLFALQVTPTGTVTSWTVVLEGSIDGTTFSTILSHTNLLGIGITTFSNGNMTPCLYFRMKCTGLILGIGTNLICKALGMR